MYRPSKRQVAKGLIPERDAYFIEKGYEYTLYMGEHSVLAQAIQNWLDAEKMHNVGSRNYDEANPAFVIGGMGWKLEIHRTGKRDTAVTYIAFFSKWENIGNELTLGDNMNRALTGLEQVLLSIDPLTWVRELPQERHVTNGIMSRPEKWEGKWPNVHLTREAAAAQKLTEGYLADRLNAMGFAANGGSPLAAAYNVPENPMITARVARNLEKEEKDRAAAEQAAKRVCPNCGTELRPEAKFCPKCGTPAPAPVPEEKKTVKENVLKQYPPVFIVEVGEPLDPFIHALIDESKNIIPEPQDHSLIEVQLAGLFVDAKKNGSQNYARVMTSTANHDNYLYVTDSRIALINRKYNKQEAGGWIGFGGLSAYAVASLLSGVEKGIKAAQRKDKALAGHIRYEWISTVAFKRRQKMLEHDMVRILYRDLEKTLWNVTLELTKDIDPEILANDLLRRVAAYHAAMTDTADNGEKMNAFIDTYKNGAGRIPLSEDPSKFSFVSVPEYYFACKGKEFRPKD